MRNPPLPSQELEEGVGGFTNSKENNKMITKRGWENPSFIQYNSIESLLPAKPRAECQVILWWAQQTWSLLPGLPAACKEMESIPGRSSAGHLRKAGGCGSNLKGQEGHPCQGPGSPAQRQQLPINKVLPTAML